MILFRLITTAAHAIGDTVSRTAADVWNLAVQVIAFRNPVTSAVILAPILTLAITAAIIGHRTH